MRKLSSINEISRAPYSLTNTSISSTTRDGEWGRHRRQTLVVLQNTQLYGQPRLEIMYPMGLRLA